MNKDPFEEDLEVALRRNSALPLDPDIVVCLETGWSWPELMATPAWVVRDVKVYLQKRALVQRERQKAREAKARMG